LIPAEERSGGLYTPQQGKILNDFGFPRVTIVTGDENLLDFTWRGLSKNTLLDKMRRKRDYCRRSGDTDNRDVLTYMIKWLSDPNCDNQLIIDDNFPKYIRQELDRGRPLGASFNWTKLWRRRKTGARKGGDDIGGYSVQHAVVVRGYDDQGIFVVDSHWKNYTHKLSRYRNGYYKIPWSKYLVSAPSGDLILVH
jgi:hypothetical protein